VLRQLFADTRWSSVLSGLMTVVVGWAGPNVLIFSVQQAAGLPASTTWSWMWAHTVITGLTSIYLSLRLRQPVLSTWSTPGIAFLVTALPGIPFSEAVGAFIVSGVLVLLLGTIRPLVGLLAMIPTRLAAALNAAILLPFALHVATAVGELPLVVGAMVVGYFVVRRLSPGWAVAAVLGIGVLASAATGLVDPSGVRWSLTVPEIVVPELTLRATLSLALPLTLLAFTGQFVPGFGVLTAQGYRPSVGPVMRTCGAASVGAAFLGCHNLTIAALLANMVSGPDVHPDLDRRYPAAVWAGAGTAVLGLFSGSMLMLIGTLPSAVLAALAGLALVSALGQSLGTAFTPDHDVPGSSLAPAVVVGVTVSGLAPWGIGSAFWGICVGLAVHALEKVRTRNAPPRLLVGEEKHSA
jgi:benzoate membrane transport protein